MIFFIVLSFLSLSLSLSLWEPWLECGSGSAADDRIKRPGNVPAVVISPRSGSRPARTFVAAGLTARRLLRIIRLRINRSLALSANHIQIIGSSSPTEPRRGGERRTALFLMPSPFPGVSWKPPPPPLHGAAFQPSAQFIRHFDPGPPFCHSRWVTGWDRNVKYVKRVKEKTAGNPD